MYILSFSIHSDRLYSRNIIFLLLFLVTVHISLQFSYCMVHLINFCGVTISYTRKKTVNEIQGKGKVCIQVK